MPTEDLAQNIESESAISRITSVAVVIGALAAIVAGATIWLLLTDPVTVLNAVDEGQVSPLVRQLADTLNVSMTEVFKHPDIARKMPTEASTAKW